MVQLPAAERLAPIVAGAAGLAWFWAELAQQRTEFQDTDNPATSLQFLAAYPDAWQQAGYALAIAAIALVATVLTTRERLMATSSTVEAGQSPVGLGTVSVVGLFAAAMLFGMACVRLSGGPVLYVRGLDEAWGEMAYLVTQFVGVQLLLVGGLALLAMWIAGVAWIGARRGVLPRLVVALAILPALRLLATPALSGFLPEELWIVGIAAIPAAFAWLVLLGVWRPSGSRTGRLSLDPAVV